MRYLRIFGLVLVVLGLAACGASTPADEAATPTAAITAVPTAAPLPTTDSAPPPAVTAVPTTSPDANNGDSAPLLPTLDPAELGPGALIDVSMNGRVGVLLDELPADLRDRAAAELLAASADFWTALAQRQLRLTSHRLNFRNFVYAGKGQLPLPPPALWEITFSGPPVRETVQGHELVIRPYRFASTLLTDADSPGVAEPALAEVGGVWQEPFIFPLDPDLLLQRTGNACLNEAGFPPNSFDSENVDIFYDFACTPQSAGPVGCHRNEVPSLTCLEAVDAWIGRFETSIRYERLPWDAALADAVRVGPVTQANAPDLHVVTEDLHTNRIVYRYFTEAACALEENAIGAPGWRRLLLFDATLHNIGSEALHIGPVVAEDPLTNMFDYNACHDHFHFSNYGDFIFNSDGQTSGSKQAFCVESTSRFSNNEAAPLIHDYSCSFQGIQAGWVDEYGAGLDVQWIDITDVEFDGETAAAELGFVSNTDQFLCEGMRVRDEAGNQLYEPSGFRTAAGLPISRPQCEFVENWDVNNAGRIALTVPARGSFVTEPCASPLLGPRRNCGFTAVDETLTCNPGEGVSLPLRAPEDAPQVVRVCEVSDVLGTGVACTFSDSLVSQVVAGETAVSFTCPQIRDTETFRGGYAVYAAPAAPWDAVALTLVEPEQEEESADP